MSFPEELQYTAEHEWLRIEGDEAVVGITSYAAEQLGDVVYVDLPEVGRDFAAGEVIGEIESTKSVGELFAPASGTVLEVNQAVADAPELVNADAFGEGWLVRIRIAEAPETLTAEQYRAQLS